MIVEDFVENGLCVTNFRNGDNYTVSYPFPILSGFVTHPEGRSVKEVIVTGSPENDLGVEGKQKIFGASWRVVNRCFRGVLRLNFGKNIFFLTAQIGSSPCLSEVVLCITLFYEPVENPEHFVLPVYIICSDSLGSFQSESDEDGSLESALRRISTGAGLLQSATAEILFQEGFSKKTFHLLLDSQGLPRCEIFRTRLKMAELHEKSDEKLWKFLQTELREAFPAHRNNCKFLSFLAATRFHLPDFEPVPYRYEDILKFVKGHVALGGSSLALCGTGCLYTWPESVDDLPKYLMDERPVDGRRFMDDSAYRGTRWACFSTTLGAACHELGHTFDLGHEPEGIMARGFDDIYTVFTSARPASLIQPENSTDTAATNKNSEFQTETHREEDHRPPQPSQPTQSTQIRSPVKARVSFKVVETSSGTFKRQREYTYSSANMDPASGTLERKERTSLAAKMSGKLFSSSKKKDFRSEEVVVTTKRVSSAIESPFADVDICGSIPSSCAISLFDAENSQAGVDSCNVSTISTRPSSMTSTLKKSRAWHKRLSIGEESEQFSQNTKKIEKKTNSEKNSSKTVIKKHYDTFVVSSPSGLSIGEHERGRPQSGFSVEGGPIHASTNQNEQKQIFIKEEKLATEKSHKSTWSRLFSAKKKKERLAEFSEVEEQKVLSADPTSQTEETTTPTSTTRQPPTLQAGVRVNSDAVNRQTEEVASKTGSHGVSDPVGQCHQQLGVVAATSVATSESEESCSPDSLEEEFQFEFESPKKQKFIATAISQDLFGEIRHVGPPKTASPPAVDGGLESGGSSTTPEPDFVVSKIRQQEIVVAKPQPSERNRRNGNLEAIAAIAAPPVEISAKASEVRRPKRAEDILAKTNKKQAEKIVQFESTAEKNQEVDLARYKESENSSSKEIFSKMPKKSERKVKISSKIDSPSGNQTVQSQNSSRGISNEKVTGSENQRKLSSQEEQPMKETFILGLANSRGAAPTPQAFHYPVNDIQLAPWKEKTETRTNSVEAERIPENSEPRPRVDLRVAPPTQRPNSKTNEQQPNSTTNSNSNSNWKTNEHQANVMTGSLKSGVSKLRFPLRTMQSSMKTEGKEEQRPPISSGRNSVLNFIPTRSTLSSRNKENKLKSGENQAKTNSGEIQTKKAEKTKSLPGSVVRRKSFGRKSLGRNSSRKKRNVKEDSSKNVLKKEKLATAAPSQRLDFKQINDNFGIHNFPTHKRSGSRDSIGNLGTFLMTDADFEEGKDSDGQTDIVEDGATVTTDVAIRSTLPRKQHCSSLINTPSGISVMEEVNTPHRLPLPVAPPSSPSDRVMSNASSGPKWTKNCASLLNYHKWFNPHVPADPQTPPQLDGYALSASGGLRLIELRDVFGNVLQHWEYLDGIRTAPETFTLPLSPTSTENTEKTVVVAIDIYGNILHRTVRGKFTGPIDT